MPDDTAARPRPYGRKEACGVKAQLRTKKIEIPVFSSDLTASVLLLLKHHVCACLAGTRVQRWVRRAMHHGVVHVSVQCSLSKLVAM